MTLATDIATLGQYNATDISNAVTQAFDILSLYYGSTLAEDDIEDWDRVAKLFAIHLLDRLDAQERSKTEPNVDVPPIMTEDIRNLIRDLSTDATTIKTTIYDVIDYTKLSTSKYWSV